MTHQLNPYVHFDGQAAEALAFYGSVFGGEPDVMTFASMGMEGPGSEKVMHGYLGADGIELMASDLPPGETQSRGKDSITMSLSGDDDARLRSWFNALAEGGEVHTPLEKQMWGDEFGQCLDRFGITWLVNITAPAEG